MSAPHSALDRLIPPQRRVRIRHPWGKGHWFDASEEPALRAICDDCNAKYGAGTHYLEWE